MLIHGFYISHAQQDACLAVMHGTFTKKAVDQAAIAAGVPEFDNGYWIAHRLADRLLQKLRRAGKIYYDYGGVWVEVK